MRRRRKQLPNRAVKAGADGLPKEVQKPRDGLASEEERRQPRPLPWAPVQDQRRNSRSRSNDGLSDLVDPRRRETRRSVLPPLRLR